VINFTTNQPTTHQPFLMNLVKDFFQNNSIIYVKVLFKNIFKLR